MLETMFAPYSDVGLLILRIGIAAVMMARVQTEESVMQYMLLIKNPLPQTVFI